MTERLKLGQRVDLVRESVGVSRTQLAKDLGLDRSTVTKWASGSASPRDIEAVAERLGVPVAVFFQPPSQRAPARRRRAA